MKKKRNKKKIFQRSNQLNQKVRFVKQNKSTLNAFCVTKVNDRRYSGAHYPENSYQIFIIPGWDEFSLKCVKATHFIVHNI